MAILASTIITGLRERLSDPAPGALWLDATFLGRMSEAERAIVGIKRDAYPVRGNVPMVAGTKQALPAGGVAVLEPYANVVSGRRVTIPNRALVDAGTPFFPIATQEASVQHILVDVRDPARFDVLPPNDGTGLVDMLYGATPPPLAAVTDPINLPDVHEASIIAYVLSLCYADETPKQSATKAEAYNRQWVQLTGGGAQAQVTAAAKPQHPGGS